jgi:hypothetical protein
MTEERPEGGTILASGIHRHPAIRSHGDHEATMAPGAHPRIGRPHFGSAESLPAPLTPPRCCGFEFSHSRR